MAGITPLAALNRRRCRGIRRSGRGLPVIVLAGLLHACVTVGPDYTPPETRMPDLWHQALARGLVEGRADLQTWWTNLNDPQLNNLIKRATAGNLDLKGAVARILEARANVGVAAGQELPAVDGSGQIEHNRISNNVITTPDPSRQRISNMYEGRLNATWEIDLWGRLSRQVESADAGLQASLEDYRDVLVSLYGEVARTYVQIRTFQARIAAAIENVETQRKTLRLVEDRRAAELASDLEVAQAELNLSRTESSVPLLRRQLVAQIHRLGVLLGERPSVLYAELAEPKPIPIPPTQIIVGLPTELLRQRPDLRAAERRLAEQTAQIGVATAELYPRFSLTGFFGYQSFGSADLFNWESRVFGLGPTVQWRIFDGGRIRSEIQAEDAQTQQALFSYEQTVLDALEEVETSMSDFVQEFERREILKRSVDAAQKSVDLVQTLYVTGLTDFQNVQDQERSLAQQDDEFAQSEGGVTLFLINLYVALGGGWAPAGQQISGTPVTSLGDDATSGATASAATSAASGSL